MMDDDTLTVAYRDWRGEPRGKKRDATRGDCIDCMACVNVCPMGIDIREGQQMECITCALCIDACDEIMDKIDRPRGLIDYLALADEPEERAGKPPKPLWRHVLRLRTIIYTSLWSLIGIALIYALFIQSDIDMTVEPSRNPTFVTLSDGTVRNVYTLRLRNKLGESRQFQVSLTSMQNLQIQIEGAGGDTVTVAPDSSTMLRVYVTADSVNLAANLDQTDLRFWVEDVENGDRASRSSVFNGKGEK